jgi:predicted membrane protein
METSTIFGTVGVSLLLIAFLLNLFRIIKEDSLPYILLNIGGAAIACAASVMIEFIPFVVLEVIWTLVGIAGLIRYFTKKKKSSALEKPQS